jgi:hypothetical protein
MTPFGDSEIAGNKGQSNFEPNDLIWRPEIAQTKGVERPA